MKKCDCCGAVCIGLSVACPFCGGERICLSSERIAYDGEIILTDNADDKRQCRLCEYFYREYGLQELYFCAKIFEGHLCRYATFKSADGGWTCKFFERKRVEEEFSAEKV